MNKSSEETITVSLRMPKSLSDWADKRAKSNRRSKSAELILYLLEKKAKTPN